MNHKLWSLVSLSLEVSKLIYAGLVGLELFLGKSSNRNLYSIMVYKSNLKRLVPTGDLCPVGSRLNRITFLLSPSVRISYTILPGLTHRSSSFEMSPSLFLSMIIIVAGIRNSFGRSRLIPCLRHCLNKALICFFGLFINSIHAQN